MTSRNVRKSPSHRRLWNTDSTRPVSRAQGYQPDRLRPVEGEGLVHDNVLTRTQRGLGQRCMGVVGCRNDDDIEVRVLAERDRFWMNADVRQGDAHCVRASRGNGSQSKAGHGAQHRQMKDLRRHPKCGDTDAQGACPYGSIIRAHASLPGAQAVLLA